MIENDKKIQQLLNDLKDGKIRIKDLENILKKGQITKSDLEYIIAKYNKKRSNLIYVFIALLMICVAVCINIGCFSSSQNINQQQRQVIKEKTIQKVDYSRFVDTWNKQIYDLKYNIDSMFEANSLEKYILKNDIGDITKKLKMFLQFEDDYLQQLAQMKNLKFAERFYLPVIMWIDSKNKIKYIDIDQNISQSELEESVAKAIGDPYFSPNSINRVIQLNEFCYYFERNKNIFFKEGLSKSITKCEYIQKNLDKNEIELKLYEK